MRRLWLDTETFSSVPITYGTHAYVDSPDFEVIIATWAWDDEPVQAIEHPTPEFFQDLIDRADEVVIHNSTFDRLALRRIGVRLPLAKIHDTMVRALMHSLPGSLDKLCDILRVPVDKAKDKAGKRLIQLFTKPRPKNMKLRRATKETHPEDWAAFLVYAGLDVDAMREVYKRIPFWNWKPEEIDLWRLDQEINDRGVQIDLDLADAALRAFERNKERLSHEVRALTTEELQSTTQRDLTLAYVRRLGLDLPDMKGGTIEAALKEDNVPEDVKSILENRLQAAATSPAKYRVLQRATSADGRLRNVLQFCGAMRTGRWGGRLFQPQNLPRPALIGLHEEALQLEIDFAIQALKADVADVFYDDVTEACTASVRGSIIAAPGTKLVVADLSNIEGRKLAWLAREDWKLQAFRDYDAGRGPDIYKVTAAAILGKKVEDVTKDERQGQGKVPELACGYQGSVGAFTTMGAVYGLVLPEDEVLTIVRGWRGRHPNTVNMWYDTERAAISAVRDPGTVYRAGRLAFHYEKGWLRMRLPSGRYLCYPQAEVGGGRHVCDKCEGCGWVMDRDVKVPCNWCEATGIIDLGKPYLSYMGVDQYTKQWKRLATYGGKLIENATQASSRDILAHGIKLAEAAGYRVVLHIHDELICEVPDSPEYSAEGLAALMSTLPEWAAGLPLAAAGYESYRYRKD